MPIPSSPDSMITITPSPPDADLISLLEAHREEVILALANTQEVCLRAFDRLKVHPDPRTQHAYNRYCALVSAGTNPDGTIIPTAPQVPQALEDVVYGLQEEEREAIAEAIYVGLITYLPRLLS